MEAAVQRWTADAQLNFRGGELLRRKAAMVERMMRELSRLARCDADLPPDLQGLTAIDLTVAHSDLLKAAAEWEARKAAMLSERAA
jgi:hypothetical protein